MARWGFAVGMLLVLGALALVEGAQCPYLYATANPGCADCENVQITKQVWSRGQLVNKTFTKTNCTACNTGYKPTSVTEGGKVIAVCLQCAPGYGLSFKAFPTTCVKCTNNSVPLWLESNIKVVKSNGTCVAQLRRTDIQPASQIRMLGYSADGAYSPKGGAITIPPECKQFVPGVCVQCPSGSTANAAGVTCFAGNGTANATALP